MSENTTKKQKTGPLHRGNISRFETNNRALQLHGQSRTSEISENMFEKGKIGPPPPGITHRSRPYNRTTNMWETKTKKQRIEDPPQGNIPGRQPYNSVPQLHHQSQTKKILENSVRKETSAPPPPGISTKSQPNNSAPWVHGQSGTTNLSENTHSKEKNEPPPPRITLCRSEPNRREMACQTIKGISRKWERGVSTHMAETSIFTKRLSQSDTNDSLLVQKANAERYFPQLDGPGKFLKLRVFYQHKRIWSKMEIRSYQDKRGTNTYRICRTWQEYVDRHSLKEGDFVSLYRLNESTLNNECQLRFRIEFEKAKQIEKPQFLFEVRIELEDYEQQELGVPWNLSKNHFPTLNDSKSMAGITISDDQLQNFQVKMVRNLKTNSYYLYSGWSKYIEAHRLAPYDMVAFYRPARPDHRYHFLVRYHRSKEVEHPDMGKSSSGRKENQKDKGASNSSGWEKGKEKGASNSSGRETGKDKGALCSSVRKKGKDNVLRVLMGGKMGTIKAHRNQVVKIRARV